jgi:hypothetical protein
MSSDPGGNKGPNTGPAGMTGTTTVAGKTVKQYGTKQDAEKANLQNFQQSRINKVKDTKVIGSVGALKGAFAYGAGVTSKFFTDKVLTSGKAKKNIGYTQSEFASLTKSQQDKVYSDYMSKRMAGQTDAYGNLQAGYRQENIAHRKADGTMTTKTVIMGGNDKGGQSTTKTAQQIEAENVAIQKAAQAEKDQAAAEQADAYKKKRLSITSSRSLFARPGGRGFFN